MSAKTVALIASLIMAAAVAAAEFVVDGLPFLN